MFSGIVEAVGAVVGTEPLDRGVRIRIREATVAASLSEGDSVAVAGVCQTVVAVEQDVFAVEAIEATLSRTTLGGLAPGARVNLERSLALGERLGGHLVQGHVDGVGKVLRVERGGEHVLVDFELPPVVADVTVLHGSIALDGVSLTVNALPAPGVAQVALIPYTWEHTTLRGLEPGAGVNLEGDMLGKFVVAYLNRRADSGVERR